MVTITYQSEQGVESVELEDLDEDQGWIRISSRDSEKATFIPKSRVYHVEKEDGGGSLNVGTGW